MLSVVVPFYNEEKTVGELHRGIFSALSNMGVGFEIIFIDDGSTDDTWVEIKKLNKVIAVRLKRNFGQTVALSHGLARVKNEIVVTMDSDLENLPEDIPRLVAKLKEGYDVVCGWRKNRWSQEFFTRKLPSYFANLFISVVSGVNLHDHGCGLRAYKRKVFEDVSFNGDMHRMLAIYLGINGSKIVEIPVSFVPRKHGVSKYGLSRTFKVILDIVAFFFFKKFSNRPMHFFGYFGFISIGLGFLAFLYSLYLKFFEATQLNRTPLPELVAILVVVGFQFVLMGLVAELITRSGPKSGKINQDEVGEEIHN